MSEKQKAYECYNKTLFDEFASEVMNRAEDKVASIVDSGDLHSVGKGCFHLLELFFDP